MARLYRSLLLIANNVIKQNLS